MREVYDSYGRVKDEVVACEKLVWAPRPLWLTQRLDTSSENNSEKKVDSFSRLSNALTPDFELVPRVSCFGEDWG